MSEEKKCLNCGEIISSNFCANCGQKAKVGRLTFHEIIAEFLSSVFNIDAPFPKTLSKMFHKPHLIIREFIEGKRKSYYSPIKYMVLCLFLNILIGELLGFDPIENQRAMDNGPMDEHSQIGYKAGEFLSQYLNYFLFILPFSIAFFSKLFFWRSPLNMAERTTIGFYMAGQFIVISLVPIILSKFHPMLFNLMHPLAILYFTYTFYNVFSMKSKFGRLFLSFLTAFISFLGYIAIGFMLALLIVIQFNL